MATTTSQVDQQFDDLDDQRRIKDVESARSIFTRFLADNTLRASTFVQTRNQLEGGRPFNPADLERQGNAWQTNVNFGDAQSARDRTLLPYWRAIHNAPKPATFSIDSNSPDSGKWEIALAECFEQFLADWGQAYFVNYMRFAKNFVDFGPGMVMWPDEDSPRYEAINVQRVYFPKNCHMDQDKWECVAFVREMSGAELYSKIRNDKAKKDAEYIGWNIDAVKAAIVYGQDGTLWDGRDFTKYQDMLVNNDIAVTSKFQPIEVVYLFMRQFSGKIGCYAFTRQSAGNDFLYSDEEYADKFQDFLGVVWYDTGTDAMVHSIKGFGIKNYHFSVLQNRMKSRVCDGAAISMSMNFSRTADMPDESPPVENYGPVNIFPSGLTQFQTYPQFSQGLNVIEMLEQNNAENNSIYREQQQQVGETDTATQAKILASMQSDQTEASMSIYLAQVGENIFSQCFERLRRSSSDPDAKKFRKRAKAKGVPNDVLNDGDILVRTGASANMANPAVRAMKFQQAMAFSNRAGWNTRWFDEQYIADQFGSNAVGKALLPEGENSMPMQRRQAMMENGDFGQGMLLPVDPSDAHPEHIDEHLKPIEGILQQYTQGGGKIDQSKVPAMVIAMEHTGQHFQFLEQDETKKAAFQALYPRFTKIQSVLRGILSRLQKQQQQAQLQQQMGGPPTTLPMGAPQTQTAVPPQAPSMTGMAQ
jgi:hypothetical protein